MSKVCRTCKETKNESDYSIASSGKKGVNFRYQKLTMKTQCKACDAAYAREFRKKNKGYRGSGKVSKHADRYLSSAISDRLISAKHRAKKANQILTVDKDYLMCLFENQGGRCAISGETLAVEPKQLNSLSLDKINPSKGYIIGNVQWLCWAVNRAKGEMTQEMFLNMCRMITEKCNDYP